MSMKLTEEQIERVKSLEDSEGRITADAVVAEARQKSSPLHGLFDWNTKTAAEQWWRECAREIIRTVTVVVTTTHATVKAPFYTRDTDAAGQQGYRSVVALRRDPIAARQTVIDELQRAVGCLSRARSVAVALNLEDEVEELISTMTGLQRRIELEESAPAEVRPS